ncbi:hypothetical protein AB0M46_33685 [Dactylosporangium sp. NPDC051485]|uniref:hypothetical protein n=1 Tax=Dactylosporangium sp. NPDC051485 TaxID=3154846 RepID=UPI00343ADC04
MKLTVGRHPAGVYWRRRAIVGGVILVAAVLLWTSCGGSDPSDRKTASSASGGAPTSAPAAPSVTIQVPTTGDPGATTTSGPPATTSPAAPAFATVPPCADADLSVVATPDQVVQFRGAYLKFMLKIKNTTTHDCVRDIGADAQELYLTVGAVKMWSSDDCDAPKGTQMAVLKPSIEVSFTNVWNGKATNAGCANKATPPAGKYGLVGRLGTKISEPVQVQLT